LWCFFTVLRMPFWLGWCQTPGATCFMFVGAARKTTRLNLSPLFLITTEYSPPFLSNTMPFPFSLNLRASKNSYTDQLFPLVCTPAMSPTRFVGNPSAVSILRSGIMPFRRFSSPFVQFLIWPSAFVSVSYFHFAGLRPFDYTSFFEGCHRESFSHDTDVETKV